MNVIWIVCGVCAFVFIMIMMAVLGIIALLVWRRYNLKEKELRKQEIRDKKEPDVEQPDTSNDETEVVLPTNKEEVPEV